MKTTWENKTLYSLLVVQFGQIKLIMTPGRRVWWWVCDVAGKKYSFSFTFSASRISAFSESITSPMFVDASFLLRAFSTLLASASTSSSSQLSLASSSPRFHCHTWTSHHPAVCLGTMCGFVSYRPTWLNLSLQLSVSTRHVASQTFWRQACKRFFGGGRGDKKQIWPVWGVRCVPMPPWLRAGMDWCT